MIQQPKEMYHVDISTSIFRSATDVKAYTVQQSALRVYKDNNYSYTSESTIQIQQDKLSIDIDTNERRVILSNRLNSDLLGFKAGQFDNIDSTRYRFYCSTVESKRYLKVEEVEKLSSMQTVCFVFDKQTNKISQLEMLYWPANYTMNSLDDVSLEQPKVVMKYTTYGTISNTEELTKLVQNWVIKNPATKDYGCPKPTYEFDNLLKIE